MLDNGFDEAESVARFPVQANDFSFHSVQIGSMLQATSYSIAPANICSGGGGWGVGDGANEVRSSPQSGAEFRCIRHCT